MDSELCVHVLSASTHVSKLIYFEIRLQVQFIEKF